MLPETQQGVSRDGSQQVAGMMGDRVNAYLGQ